MKQVNFSHPGGFPLEQETLERLQTAYRSELYEAIKRHLSILPDTNYIIAHAQNGKQGWAVIHQDGEGILYPMTATVKTDYSKTDYLKTTKTTTKLIYGSGASQTAYTDYQAEYVSAKGTPSTNDTETVNYYDLGTFKTVKSIQEIETIIAGIDGRVKTIEATVPVIDNRVKTIEATIPVIDNRVKTIETTLPTIDTRINTIKNDLESYLPLDGSKAMKGDLNLGTHHLYLNTLNTATSNDYLLALNNQNQVVKNSTLLSSLIERIETLEGKTATATTSIPIGMIALWGQSAPFPEGWEEYIPLRGRMPVGFDNSVPEFNTINKAEGSKTSNGSFNVGGNFTRGGFVGSFGTPPGKIIVSTGFSESDYLNLSGSVFKSIGTIADSGTIDFTTNNLNPYRVVHFIKYVGK